MSAVATAYVWSRSKATGSSLLVLLAIADAANQQCENSYQSVNTLAKMARVSESTVHRSLKELLERGEVEVAGVHEQFGTRIYRLGAGLTGGVNLTPPTEGGVTDDTGGGVISEPEGVSPMTPKPSTNPTTTTPIPPSRTGSTGGEVKGKMSPSWQVSSAAGQDAVSRFPGLNHRREMETFRDWHIAQDTGARTATQWDSLFLTWCARKQDLVEAESPSGVQYDEVTGMPINPRPPRYAE